MRFQQGDKVTYMGKKFASDLQGKLGEVVGRLANCSNGVVVDFGGDAYVLDENKHVGPFQGHLKSDHSGDKEDKRRSGPEVKKRRPSRKEQAEDNS
jgi:hypothetical protein